jgi:type IV pilus assembly protein PilA
MPSRRGFTLIELMVVIAIVAVLAALAIPSFVRYQRRSKTTEALTSLHHLFRSAVAYYESDHATALGHLVSPRFPASQAVTPNDLTQIGPTKRVPLPEEWHTPTWNSLNFAITSPHYYAYQFDSEGTFIGASFTAAAFGDLDGDGLYSTFVRLGSVRPGSIAGTEGVYFANELE